MSRLAAETKRKSIYSVHPGVLMTQKWIARTQREDGRSLEEWIKHIKKAGPKGEMERRQWLKDEHKLGTIQRRGWLNVPKARISTGDPDLYLESAGAGRR
jgi:hypothetical protein